MTIIAIAVVLLWIAGFAWAAVDYSHHPEKWS